jgi:L-threonylcarbamoyladenylate synthase
VIDEAVAAICAGKPVILPTDTVYGLCAAPDNADAVERLSRLKRRDPQQPIALVASNIHALLEHVPELPEEIVRALLPGAYTLVLPNPERRFPWLAGERADTIGVRVPALGGRARAVFDRVRAVAATSANLHGDADPRSVAEIPEELRAGVAAIVDAGELPGTASTVVDFTGPEPRVLREGAGDVVRALSAAG